MHQYLDEKHLSLPLDSLWEKGDPNQLVFRSDSRLELGAANKGISGTLITSDPNLLNDGDILVYGPDISSLKADSSYARIALIEVDDKEMGEGKDIYSSIRKIDYVRYHVSLDGMMFRISPIALKESIVISKKAYENGISFKDIGKRFIEAFENLKQVKRAKIMFISDPNFDFDSLSQILNKAEDITKALDHLLSKVKMDCHFCSLQKVCEEVETLCIEEFPRK